MKIKGAYLELLWFSCNSGVLSRDSREITQDIGRPAAT